jgi:hypothetical protein
LNWEESLRRVHADKLLIKEIFSHVEESYRDMKEKGYSERDIYFKLQQEIGSPAEIDKACKGHAAPGMNVFYPA